MATEREIRSVLAHAIRVKDPEAAKCAIQYGMKEGFPLETMTDLHFSLMMLLAAPKPETRGAKKKPAQADGIWHMNMACKIRAHFDKKSFADTWEKHCKSTRPKITNDDVVTCASILQFLIEDESKNAKNAANTFRLSNEDIHNFLLPHTVKK